MSSFNTISFRKARAADWRAARSRAHRCADQGGFRRRPALHSRRPPPASRNGVVLGAGVRRAFDSGHLRKRPEAQRGRRGLAAPCWLACGRSSRRRACRLGSSAPAARARKQTAPARSARAHGVGDTLEAENRSHRLSLAHPPLRRSWGGVPLRLARGSAVGRGAFQRRALRYRRGLLEPPRRAAARSTPCSTNWGFEPNRS